MPRADGVDVLVSEVGPRDGLQSVASLMSLKHKKAWIDAEAAAGVREIEVGSFVPAHVLPSMADTGALVRHAKAIPGLTVAALVPNLKGAQAAVEAGADKITLPVSVSETHSLRNVRRTHAQMIQEAQAIAALLATLPPERRPSFEGGLSTAFGCTLEGPVADTALAHLAEALMQAGCDEVGLSDTSGYANPAEVKRLVRLVRDVVGEEALSGLHLHNTRGLGLANALAGLEVGITTLDASLGGLGGCPFAPGASGNIVTEDLVFMLQAMGLKTGIDLERLVEVRRRLADWLPGEAAYGFLADTGPPLGFAAPEGESARPGEPAFLTSNKSPPPQSASS
ncbi:hydroxymethylglutaryl-CoA lyase [Caulobacter sp. S45]|uniref:hydroxymethylglutaryl-CoA lyase n=1 Tax=Caulobacter sp. S45 TaxID=1641861 RepID=UPI0015766D83|nr:hydroxymethylglutaryl-CoA lyase [Caulobacter sp. S45]